MPGHAAGEIPPAPLTVFTFKKIAGHGWKITQVFRMLVEEKGAIFHPKLRLSNEKQESFRGELERVPFSLLADVSG